MKKFFKILFIIVGSACTIVVVLALITAAMGQNKVSRSSRQIAYTISKTRETTTTAHTTRKYQATTAMTSIESTPAPTTKNDIAIQNAAKIMCEGIEKVKADALDLSYSEAMRNPESYFGKTIVAGGKVIQVMEKSYRIADDYTLGGNSYLDHVWLIENVSSNEERILEDDIVNFYGIYMGETSYKSVMGATIYVPLVLATHFEIVQQGR